MKHDVDELLEFIREFRWRNLTLSRVLVNSNRGGCYPRAVSRQSFCIALSAAAVLVACGGPEVRHPYKADDNTPANSTSETRLAGDDPAQPKTTSAASSSAETAPADPTQPQINKVSEMPKADGDDGAGAGGGGGAGKSGGGKGPDKAAAADKGQKPSKTGPKISKAECDKAFEKAIELEIGNNPQFAGLDKAELINMTKSMAKQQHGDAPCDATRSQYTCAMAATSTAQWKRCMQ